MGAQKLLTGHDASASLRHHQMALGRNGMDGGSSESTAEEEDNEVGVLGVQVGKYLFPVIVNSESEIDRL